MFGEGGDQGMDRFVLGAGVSDRSSCPGVSEMIIVSELGRCDSFEISPCVAVAEARVF